jgi:hypothetical protein
MQAPFRTIILEIGYKGNCHWLKASRSLNSKVAFEKKLDVSISFVSESNLE